MFAAPGIRRFHLHERVARELTARGHRVTLVTVDPVAATFWSAQGLSTLRVAPATPAAHRYPTRELAANDCLLQGVPADGRALDRATARLDHLLPMVLRCFDDDPPDLLFGHVQRTGVHRLLQYVARECGCRTAWTGDGLLPHTLQADDEGVDGDAALVRRVALDYRDVRADERLLAAALAAVLGRTTPAPLTRKPIATPRWRARLHDSLGLLLGGQPERAIRAWFAWRLALAEPAPRARNFELPAGPFVTVLLQREDEAAVRLDCGVPPSASALVAATRNAAIRIDPAMRVVAVLPAGGVLADELRRLRRLAGVQLEVATAAPDAAAAATAVITINHPAATTALLAGTPVLHLGRALFAMPGVTHKTMLDDLATTLRSAITADGQPELRARFLTAVLGHDHIWCSPDQPDHNGLSGLVLAIETALQQRSPNGTRLRYRAGPTWPLALESPS
ncbi:MAG: hypothetical protein IPK26_01340 [Planctomycetes bacterium]|nr:hypothetical protein [Planctomycetota bacterium]